MKKTFFLLMGIALILTACNNHSQKQGEYFDLSAMDTTINPGNDFFSYCNGNWVKGAHIPDDQSRWGSFDSLHQANINKLRGILEEAASKTDLKKGSLEQKAGDFYASGMDTNAIEKLGYEPLKPLLAKIEAIKNYTDLIDFVAAQTKEGDGDLIAPYAGSDQRNSAMNILNLYQTGTSLPEKSYYTKTDSITANQRTQLVNHAAKYFALTGEDSISAAKDAADILTLETLIAASHLSRVEMRDPLNNYHKMSVDDLQKLSPNIAWKNTFAKIGITVDSLNVAHPAYYKTLSELLAKEPISVWKNKLRFDYIADKAGSLSKVFRDEDFKFDQLFSGDKVQKERWKKMVETSDSRLRDVLSQLYVQKYFTPEAKARMDELVDNLQKAFKARIEKLAWMSDATKKKALEKLAVIMKKIGYPTRWKSYDDVAISRTDYYGNLQALSKHYYNEQLNKIGKPVDKTEWGMTAPTVNAYYNPSYNEIVFPAGILQWPFFDANADDALNYGGIGVVIGHEMTHGFDDEGRHFDAQGNLTDWWTPADGDAFILKAKGLVDQFNQYVVLDSLHVNGALTLGENIADLGGVTISYDAFKLTKQGQGNEKMDGFTPDQRFFMGFAQVWRGVVRPEMARTLINTNPHSPYQYRVNGPLSNFEPFYKAFGVTEKDKLYRAPADRVVIW